MMKKISLKKLNLKEVEKLSREQLKNVLGGWTGESGSDGGTEGETRMVMCCPESIAHGIGCSSCVSVGPNQSVSCEMGILVDC